MGLQPPATEACLRTAVDFSKSFDEAVHGSQASSWRCCGHLISSLCLPAAADTNNPFGDGEVLSPSSASSRQGPVAHSPRPLRRSLAESKPKKLDSSTPPTGRRPLFRVSMYPCLSSHTTGGRAQKMLRRGCSQGKCMAGAARAPAGLSPATGHPYSQSDVRGWQLLRTVCVVLSRNSDILRSQLRPCSCQLWRRLFWSEAAAFRTTLLCCVPGCILQQGEPHTFQRNRACPVYKNLYRWSAKQDRLACRVLPQAMQPL